MHKGFLKIGRNRYYLDRTGRRQSGFSRIGGHIYYFKSNGRQLRNGAYRGYQFNKKGRLTNPPKVGTVDKSSLKASSPGKRQLAVRWKNVKNASGYEINYARNTDFTVAAFKDVPKGTRASLSKLNAKRYYVRVRAYKKLGNAKVYGRFTVLSKKRNGKPFPVKIK
ncbi:MAG: hypothetical protein FWH04_02295 [Oscillospiraceae bacterium]|nr:hypothetical protein [Oscillospiraceae bacterium]